MYSGPIFARVLIHSGLRSIGVSALRTSRRSSLRPPESGTEGLPGLVWGACVTPATLRPGPDPPNSVGPLRARGQPLMSAVAQTAPESVSIWTPVAPAGAGITQAESPEADTVQLPAYVVDPSASRSRQV